MAISKKQSQSTPRTRITARRAKALFAAVTFAMAGFIGVKSIPHRIPTNAPIIRQVSANNVDAVRDVVGRDAGQLRATDIDGNTPLHIAAMGGYDQMLEMLIDAGADVNAANRRGFTPLASALLCVEKNQPDIVRALIAAGARTDLQLPDGTSLRQLAATLPGLSPEVIALLGTDDGSSSGRRQGQSLASVSDSGEHK